MKKALEYPAMILLAGIFALNYTIFIFPNRFAPAGLDGICTMIQDITHVSMGYLSLLVNIPLLILAWKKLSRDFALKTSLFSISFSLIVALLDLVDLSRFAYQAGNSGLVLAPIAAGTIRGILYVFTIRLNASSGGIDIIAALIRKNRPHFNLMHIIFAMNVFVAVCSYFVYGFQLEPVLCSILYMFITSTLSSHLQSSSAERVKLEIITPNAEELCRRITEQLQLSATVLQSRGAYSGSASKMVVCVTDRKHVPAMEALVQDFEQTVIFESVVSKSIVHPR